MIRSKKRSLMMGMATILFAAMLSLPGAVFAQGRENAALSDDGLQITTYPQVYTLNNATDEDRFIRLVSVTLLNDSTAAFLPPPISSYITPPCTFSIEDGELVFRPIYENDWEKDFYGVDSGEIIARFEIIDAYTLAFKSSSVPLFADEGARYVTSRSH